MKVFLIIPLFCQFQTHPCNASVISLECKLTVENQVISWYLLNAGGCPVRVRHARAWTLKSSLFLLPNRLHEVSSQSSLPSSLTDLQQPHSSLHRHGMNEHLLNEKPDLLALHVCALRKKCVLHQDTLTVLCSWHPPLAKIWANIFSLSFSALIFSLTK